MTSTDGIVTASTITDNQDCAILDERLNRNLAEQRYSDRVYSPAAGPSSRNSMHVHVCTRFTCDDFQELKGFKINGKPIKPVNRLYVTPKDLQTGWGLIAAIGPNGRTQFFNPIRRRWTRTWALVTLVPPRRIQLNPMKRPWPAPSPEMRRRRELRERGGR